MTGKVRLRTATKADTDGVARVFLAARKQAMPDLPVLYDEARTRWWIREIVISSGNCIVAIEGGSVVGFVAWQGQWLQHLYVSPDAQRKGVGRHLLNFVKQQGQKTVKLRVFQDNVLARRFYESQGFNLIQLCDGSDNEENWPDAVYEWKAPDN